MTINPNKLTLSAKEGGNPTWMPLWGKDGSMSYGDTVPTDNALIRAVLGCAKTIKILLDLAPKTPDGIQFESTRVIKAALQKLALLGSNATHGYYIETSSNTPSVGIKTAVYKPHFAHEEIIEIINRMWMLPLGTNFESSNSVSHQQLDQFNTRLNALQSIVDRLIPETLPDKTTTRTLRLSDGDKAIDEVVNGKSKWTATVLYKYIHRDKTTVRGWAKKQGIEPRKPKEPYTFSQIGKLAVEAENQGNHKIALKLTELEQKHLQPKDVT